MLSETTAFIGSADPLPDDLAVFFSDRFGIEGRRRVCHKGRECAAALPRAVDSGGSRLNVDFPTHELYANPGATQTLLDDNSVDLAEWLADEVSMEFAEQEGDAFVNGDGSEKPRGLLSYPTVANDNWSWGRLGYIASGAAGDFAASDPSDAFIDMIYGLRRGYRQNARWLMNDLTTARIRKFKDGQGNYLWQPSSQAGEPATFMGYPHEADDWMPDVAANSLPVAFGDFRCGYLIIDRTGIRVLRDPYTNKPYVHFYTTKRVGGGIQNFQAIKVMKIASS